MNMASDIRKLGDDMIASFDARMSFISNLKEETVDMLSNFHNEHKKRAYALKDSLMRQQNERVKAVSNFLNKVRTECKGLSDAWHRVSSTIAEKRSHGQVG